MKKRVNLSGLRGRFGKFMRSLKLAEKDRVRVTLHLARGIQTEEIPCKKFYVFVQGFFTPPAKKDPKKPFIPPQAVLVEKGTHLRVIHGSLPGKISQKDMHIPI